MATERPRFVDTGSAGGDGTTSGLSGATAAYESYTVMEAGEDDTPDLVADDVFLTVAFAQTGAGTADTAIASFVGFTTDVTRFIECNGEANPGFFDTSIYHMARTTTGSYQRLVHSVVPFLTHNDFQLHVTSGDTGHAGFRIRAEEATMRRCVVRATVTGGTPGTAAGGMIDGTGTNGDRIANLVYGFTGTGNVGIDFQSSAAEMNGFNNTVYNCEVGFQATGYDDGVLKNNIANGCTTGYSGTFKSASDNNLDEGTTAPGTNEENSVAVAFVDESGSPRDLRPASSVGVNVSVGVDLTGTFDYQLTGVAWGTMGKGCLLKAVAVGGEEFLGRQYPQGVKRGVMRGVA